MFEFLFHYSPEVFDQGELIFASDWPRWALIVSLLVMALLIAGLLLRQHKSFQLPQLAVIGLLQLSMLALVLCIVWQPALRTERLRAGDNVVAVMLDVSQSMAYSGAAPSRMQQARSALTGDWLLERLENEYMVQRFVFSENAYAVESFDPLPAPGPETRLAASVLRVLRQARSTPLGAVILVSDGADNGGALAPNQLAEIAGFGVPIHTVGVGRERIPEDLELEDVLLPAKALPGTTLSARVAIRHDSAGSARVKVYDGETFVTAKEIPLPGVATMTTAFIDFALPNPGHRNLRFSLDRIPNERNVRNNTRSRVVEVPDDRYRILYIEGEPRWEYKFLRRALDRDPGIHLVSLLRVSPNKFYRQGIDSPDELADGFPQHKATLFTYDALIIGSIEAPWFTPEQQTIIRDFVSVRGGSLLMLAGTNGLGNGGWGNSIVGDVLPARLPATNAGFVREKVPAVLTALGRQTPMLKFSEDADANARLWQELPDIADYQSIGSFKPAAVTLLQLSVDSRLQPLLITQRYGRGQSYILATSGTWRWQMSLPVEDQRHETFWRQLARGLVANSPERFQLTMHNTGATVTLHAEVRNADFEPETAVNVTAVVSPETGEPLLVELRPAVDQPGILEGEFTPDQSGLHIIEAISRRAGDEPVVAARMVMRPEASRAESFSLRQNRALLEGLAAATSGQYWTRDRLDRLPNAIRNSAAGITEQHIRPLWDAPAVFLLLLALKAFEWLLRRHWSTI